MTRRFFNQRAATWDKTCSEPDAAKLEQMAERLNIKAGSTLLDVGTGTGVFLPLLSSKIGREGQVVALDFAEEMLKKARSKRLGGEIYYLQANVTSLPLRGEIFDVVVCYSSFPHFQDKPETLIEMNRVTKDGGRLLICHTSSRTEINGVHRQIPTVENDTIPDESELRGMLSRAGFVDIKIDDSADSYLASARKP